MQYALTNLNSYYESLKKSFLLLLFYQNIKSKLQNYKANEKINNAEKQKQKLI